MKKLHRLLLLCAVLSIFASCSKDSDSNNENEPSFPGNKLTTGQSAHDLLGNDIFSNLTIEVVYPDGFQPEQASLSNLKGFLEERTFKNNITISQHSIAAPTTAPYSIEEIRNIEDESRTLFNSENTITVFVFFANGNSENDEENKVTLGTAYRNTSIVIFEKTIKDFTGSITGPSKTTIETISLEHEFGHLFGLVDIGSPMQNDHQDPDNEGHCNTDGCLMNAEAESSGITGMLGNGIPTLGPNCLADLQANGGR